MKRFRKTGSMKDSNDNGRPKMSENVLDDLKEWLNPFPSKSLHKLSAQTGILNGTSQQTLKK